MLALIREEWDWIQTLSAAGEKERSGEDSEEAEPRAESHAPLLYYELQTAIKSLLKLINLPLHQVRSLAFTSFTLQFARFEDVSILLCSVTMVTVVSLQARHFRLYSQEVVELGHGVSFLLLLPAADDVCSAPGQSNPYTPLSGFLHLPLQMFELGNNTLTP